MISILFFLPDLNGGGAQRTVVNILNHVDRERFDPVLVVGWGKGPYRETIKDDVRVIDLKQRRVRASILSLAREISIQRPMVLFAPYPDANIALALAAVLSRTRGAMVMRESNHRTAQGMEWGRVKGRLVRWSFRRAERVVALSNGVRTDMIRRYRLYPRKVQTIYNPVDINFIQKMCLEENGGFKCAGGGDDRLLEVIAVGRLVRQKGFDLLIRAVAALEDISVRLTILGDGPERENLLSLAEAQGIKRRVSLPGFEANPYQWMKGADLFVLSSRWEGFGHVIVEAMVCGVPVLATRCLSGPDEIITDGVDGMFCAPENVEDLAAKMRFLLARPEQRTCLARAGKKSAHRFDSHRIVRQYERVFEAVAGSSLKDGTCGGRGVSQVVAD